MTRTTQDPFHPVIPAGAYDDLLARVLPQARARRARGELTRGDLRERSWFGNSIRSVQVA